MRSLQGSPGATASARAQASLVLVGDVGGTNARLSLWDTKGGKDAAEIYAKTYPTSSHATFELVMAAFLGEPAVASSKPQAASLAIAGPVEDNRCTMTNLSWVIDGPALQQQFGFK